MFSDLNGSGSGGRSNDGSCPPTGVLKDLRTPTYPYAAEKALGSALRMEQSVGGSSAGHRTRASMSGSASLTAPLFAVFSKRADAGLLPAEHVSAALADCEIPVSQARLAKHVPRAAIDYDEFAALVRQFTAEGPERSPEEEEARILCRKQLLERAAADEQLWAPESYARWILDAGILICVAYYAAVFPLHVQAVTDGGSLYMSRTSISLEAMLSVFQLLEVAFSFRTQVVMGSWVSDDPAVARVQYAKGLFVPDFLGSLPLDLVAHACGAGDTEVVLLQSLRSLRVCKLTSLFALSPRGFLKPGIVWMRVTFLPIFKMFFGAITLLHWLAVLFMIVFADRHTDQQIADPYVDAVYQVMEVVSTVGYGDVAVVSRSQKVYTTCLFLLSIVMNGYVVSRLTQLLVQTDLQQDHDAVLQRTLAVVKKFGLPPDLQREVLSYQYHSLSWDVRASFSQVTDALPQEMRDHISIYARIHIVARIPHFAAAAPECQVALAQALREHVFVPESRLCEEGTKGDELFFITHGCAHVHSHAGQSYAILRKGSFFGHLALLQEDSLRTASVTTITYVATLLLHRDDFGRILADHQDFSEAMEEERLAVLQANSGREQREGDDQKNPLTSPPAQICSEPECPSPAELVPSPRSVTVLKKAKPSECRLIAAAERALSAEKRASLFSNTQETRRQSVASGRSFNFPGPPSPQSGAPKTRSGLRRVSTTLTTAIQVPDSSCRPCKARRFPEADADQIAKLQDDVTEIKEVLQVLRSVLVPQVAVSCAFSDGLPAVDRHLALSKVSQGSSSMGPRDAPPRPKPANYTRDNPVPELHARTCTPPTPPQRPVL
eukprot:TRINITY_DN4696_c0_g1_i2.p1 TRINITY_DN4696_c0_g1~~TRINITY_DN4696_c0_g1_i2.p1  ORF type:complete len:836 (+),score=100.84 TRINITY_DN4696_c0_g1_i2:67-2574(+)